MRPSGMYISRVLEAGVGSGLEPWQPGKGYGQPNAEHPLLGLLLNTSQFYKVSLTWICLMVSDVRKDECCTSDTVCP